MTSCRRYYYLQICNHRGAQCAPAVRMKPVHRRNDRIPLTIPWAHNVRPYGYNGANNLQTAGGGYPVLRILYKMVSVVVCDMVFVRNGAPRLYPGAPSLALQAIHLAAPYGNMRYQMEPAGAVCSHQTNELRVTVVPRGTFSCLEGNSPCAAPAEMKPPV